MPLRSLREAGPSVETRRMPCVGAAEEDGPVACSYEGGGASGGCEEDIIVADELV
jgi:hypothetical protein